MILGITGISGSGKHTVANFLEGKGWFILDADKIAHFLYRPYTNVWKEVTREFGEKILNQDDTINRVLLGKIVFDVSAQEKSGEALKKLNQIMHPYIRRRIKEEIHHYFRSKPNIAVVAALWEEMELDKNCDKMLLLRAQKELARERIQKRDSISAEVYEIRVRGQKEPASPDFVLENNGAPGELKKRFDELYSKLS